MISKHTLGACGALILLSAIAPCAMGQVTPAPVVFFNNFGPGNTYNPISGFGFGGPFVGTQFEQAMAFTPNNNYLLTSGQFGLSLSFGQNAPFDVTVLADAGGVPGAVLEVQTVREELAPFGQLNPPIDVDFDGITLLHSGVKYWISMAAQPGTEAVWNSNNTGNMNPRAFRVNGGPWMLAGGSDLPGVFRLSGIVVPAPGAVGLFGLFACVGRRRRRV